MAYPYDDEEDPIVSFEKDPEEDPDEDGTVYGYGTRKSGKRDYVPLDADQASALASSVPAPKTTPLTTEEKAPLQASPEETAGLEKGLAAEKPAKPQVLDMDALEEQPEKTPGVQIPASSRIASEHNNPGNLKFAGQEGATEGEAAKDGGHFARFATPEAGMQALGKQVSLDASRGKTLGEFISGYAPSGSNDTQTYIAQASKALGVDPKTPLKDIDPQKVTAFIAQKESSTGGAAPAAASALPYKQGQSQKQEQSTTQGQTYSESVQQQGSAQPLQQFAEQQAKIGGAYDQAIQNAQQSGNDQAAMVLDHAKQVQQIARDKEVATQAAVAQDQARKSQVQQKMTEVTQRKTDMNGLWKDKGALGTTLGLLGVALRSLNATKFGGPNTALQSIQEQKRQNLQAQMEDRNSELRGLERELGSIEAAAPVLEARMNDALAKRLDAMTLNEKSQAIKANGAQMAANLRTERDQKLAEGAKAYYGTIARQQQAQGSQQQTMGTSQGSELETGTALAQKGKSGAEAYDDVLKLDKSLEERGYTKETRAAILKSLGYQPPTGESEPERTNREQREKADVDAAKRDTDQGKSQAALEGLRNAATARGLIRGENGKWMKGGKRGTDDEVKAAEDAAKQALSDAGQEDSANKTIAPERTWKREILRMLPFGHLEGSVTDDELAARMNAAEDIIRPRTTPTDRANKVTSKEDRRKQLGSSLAGNP